MPVHPRAASTRNSAPVFWTLGSDRPGRPGGALGIHRNLWVLSGTSRDLQVQGQVPWFIFIIGFCHARFFFWSQVVYFGVFVGGCATK